METTPAKMSPSIDREGNQGGENVVDANHAGSNEDTPEEELRPAIIDVSICLGRFAACEEVGLVLIGRYFAAGVGGFGLRTLRAPANACEGL